MSFGFAPSSRALRRLVPLLLLAVVLAQTLGAIHRIVHVPQPLRGETQKAVPTSHPFAVLFAGHASEQGCELFDQLSHADLLPAVATVLLPAVVPASVELAHREWHLAAQAAGFLARGPPATA